MPLEGVSGISGAIGYAPESAWGTSVAPTKWTEFLAGESLGRKQTFIRSQGIKAGRVFTTGSRTAATTRTAGGNLSIEVGNQSFGFWLNLLHGETVEAPATNWLEEETKVVQKQTHKIGTTDPYKKSATIVKAAPKTTGGTVDSYCYSGSILNSMELVMATNGMLVANMNVDAKDEDQTQSIGAVSYPTGIENFNFTQSTIEINSVAQAQLRDMKITFNKPTDTARFMLGSATRLQPFTNAFNDIKVEFTADYESKTLYEFFKEAATKKVVIKLVGAKIGASAGKFELEFTFPMARFEGDSPNIVDLGALRENIPLMIEDNGSEPPCTVVYKSSDKTL